MPTFTEKAERRPGERGFTLVELMVVIAIMALAATAVVLTIPGEERTVRSEADRLAARLAAARDVAVIEGRSVSVNFAPSGYGFERKVDGSWQALPGRAFAQRGWPDGVRVAAGGGRATSRILFDRIGTSPNPQAIMLTGGDAHEIVRVSATGEVSRGE